MGERSKQWGQTAEVMYELPLNGPLFFLGRLTAVWAIGLLFRVAYFHTKIVFINYRSDSFSSLIKLEHQTELS